MLETGKHNPKRNVGTAAGRATERVSDGRSALIRTNPDLVEPNKEIGRGCATSRGPKEQETDRAQP